MAEWTTKYRPRHLDEVIGQEKEIASLKTWAKKEVEDLQDFVFYGPYGVGKTSAAGAFCNDGDFKFKFMNAALYNGKEDVARLENAFMKYGAGVSDFEWDDDTPPKKSGIIFIFEKADDITRAAQDTFEFFVDHDSSRNDVKAIFIVNDLNKLTPKLRSRCDRFEFKPLKESDMRRVIQRIVDEEELDVPENVIERIIKESILEEPNPAEYKGIPRDAVRKLYSFAVMYGGR